MRWHERIRTNDQGLKRTARMKRRQQSTVSADLAGSPLLDAAEEAKNKRDKHRRKRSNSSDLSLVKRDIEKEQTPEIIIRTPKIKKRDRKGMKRPKSAGFKSAKTMSFGASEIAETTKNGKKLKKSKNVNRSKDDMLHKSGGKKKRKKRTDKGHSVQFSLGVEEEKTDKSDGRARTKSDGKVGRRGRSGSEVRRFKSREELNVSKDSDSMPLDPGDLDYDASMDVDNNGDGNVEGTPEIQRGYRHMLQYKKRHRNMNGSVVVNPTMDSEDMLLSDLNDDGIDMMTDEESDDDDDVGHENQMSGNHLSPLMPLSMRRLSGLTTGSNGSGSSSDYETAASWREQMSPLSLNGSPGDSDLSSSSSEITFSSDDEDLDDDDDDDDDDGSAVPLSVMRMRAQQQIKKNRKNSIDRNGRF